MLGSLAAGGALGNLIPPGITFIIYGLITETSVGALYLAAVGPEHPGGAAVHRRDPLLQLAPPLHGDGARAVAGCANAREPGRPGADARLLIALVLGTIYAGWATPTESAALGVAGSLVLRAGRPAS